MLSVFSCFALFRIARQYILSYTENGNKNGYFFFTGLNLVQGNNDQKCALELGPGICLL